MNLKSTIQEFCFDEDCIKILVPDFENLQSEKENDNNRVVPFWAKLWPSSIALCTYLMRHKNLLLHKNVWELGAGLGLPSLYAAHFAKHVVCSDYDNHAVAMSAASAKLNNFSNIICRHFDWKQSFDEINTDCVLLSDINYDPSDFKFLLALLKSLIEKDIKIVLSTPQRLMAKPFVEQLLAFCVDKTTIPVKTSNNTEEIFIMRLEKQS